MVRRARGFGPTARQSATPGGRAAVHAGDEDCAIFLVGATASGTATQPAQCTLVAGNLAPHRHRAASPAATIIVRLNRWRTAAALVATHSWLQLSADLRPAGAGSNITAAHTGRLLRRWWSSKRRTVVSVGSCTGLDIVSTGCSVGGDGGQRGGLDTQTQPLSMWLSRSRPTPGCDQVRSIRLVQQVNT